MTDTEYLERERMMHMIRNLRDRVERTTDYYVCGDGPHADLTRKINASVVADADAMLERRSSE